MLYGNSTSHKILNLPYDVYSKVKGKQYFYEKIDTISRRFSWDESKYVGLPVWATWLKFLDKKWFEETIYLPFEDTKLLGSAHIKEYLTYRYGDYMKLPSKEQQQAAVHAMIYDTEKDYTEYLK